MAILDPQVYKGGKGTRLRTEASVRRTFLFGLLADFDFRTSIPSWKPGFTGFASSFATDEWLMQSQTAGSYANNVGSETLDQISGLLDRPALGLDNGVDRVSRLAWEGNAKNRLHSSGSTAGDAGTSDICVRIVFRLGTQFAASDTLMSKRENAGLFPGWTIQVNGAGNAICLVDGGAIILSTATTGNVADGGWHYVTFWWDVSTGTITARTDVAADPASNTNLAVTDLTAATGIAINAARQGHSSSSMHQQMAYAGVCVGANAEAMFLEDFWQHARDPTPAEILDTRLRASLISGQIADGVIGDFGNDQSPLCYHSALAGLGLLCNGDITNLVPFSKFSTGAIGTVTATDIAADAPDGLRGATTLLATTTDDFLGKVCVTIASTPYTASVHIEESTVGLTGRVIMYDESNAAELGAVPWTGTSTPQDISVSASTIGGGISTSVRAEIDVDTETAIAYTWQLEEGTGTFAKVYTTGVSAALAQSDFRGSGDYIREQLGEVAAIFVVTKLPAAGETRYIFDTVAVSDRRALSVDSAGALKFLVNDDAGSLISDLTLGTISIDTKHTAQCQWSAEAELGGSSVRAKLDALPPVLGGSSFIDGAGFAVEVSIGASAAVADTAINAVIESVKCYGEPNPI